MNARRVSRLGMLAVGMGIGAAMASTPGIASADSGVSDPISWLAGIDPLPAATASPFDLDISVDGYTLLDIGTGASATSGTGDVAIAFGAGSTAVAEGGYGDFAYASNGAAAVAGNDVASTGNNFDTALASGFDSFANAGNDGSTTNGSSFDEAFANSGNNTTDSTYAFAEAGYNGNGDSASAIGQNVGAEAGYGSSTAANYDSASALGNFGTATSSTTEALATVGSHDTSFVFDPFGAVGSTADAGGESANNFDLAGVFGDLLHAAANTGSYLVDILPSLF